MVPFVSLHNLSDLTIADVGELAWELAQLQQLGHAVVPSGVIVASVLEQSLSTLVSREPLLADWPQMLGQTDLAEAGSLTRLLQRLKQALLMAHLDLPWDAMAGVLHAPVMRLQPSLWLPGLGTAPLTHLLGEVLCWGDEQSVAQGLKLLWGRLFSAHSWTYWQRSPRSPQGLRMAIVVQPLSPQRVTGVLRLHPHQVQVQAVQGCLQGLTTTVPDRYQGQYPIPLEGWQRGGQEWVYQPAAGAHQSPQPREYLITHPALGTALDVLKIAPLRALTARLRQALSPRYPTWHVEWQAGLDSGPFQITQSLPWPLVPLTHAAAVPGPPHPQRWLGRGAAPGQAIAPAVVVPPGEPPPPQTAPHILVANQIYPTWLPHLKTAIALVSEQGGLTSHAAILARELGIPAVVGLPHATREIRTGEALRLDGDSGVVERLSVSSPRDLPPVTPPVPAAALTLPATAPELWVNVAQAAQSATAAQLPVAGVGLLRSEWLMLPDLDQRHPYDWIAAGDALTLQQRLVVQLEPILAAFAPRPVRYRSLDLRTHEMAALRGAPAPEVNPMLGLRGAFSYQQHPELFQVELAALRQLQRSGYDNLHLLLPFVRTVEEFVYCRDQVQAMGLHQAAPFQLWMMAEVPSVLFLLPQYQAAGVEGIAIGTNDLTQLMLGVDRDQAALSEAFNETHPAVQGAIAHLLEQAQLLQLPTCICGLAPSRYPQLVTAWVRQGITGISVDMASLGDTAQAIAAAIAPISPPEP